MHSIRLLLADDNLEILETLVDMLQPAYLVVAALPDGASVLEQAPALNPDLIILDISLGDMAGFEVARRLKKAGVPAKVIFLTVHENIDFVRAAFDVGAVGYVYKSRISSDLIEAIDKICAGGHFSSADVVASGNLSP
ncbi:MAG: response regulator transcription factor [Candidatus Korobacteraceae bacterium]